LSSAALSPAKTSLANDLRNQIGGDGRWYTAGRRNDTGRNARYRGDPSSGWDGTSVRAVNSVSGYGVNVGRGSEATSLAFFEGPALTYSTVPGGTGVRADAIGVSPSFGKSVGSDFDIQWICGQVQNYGDAQNQMQAFRWKRGQGVMTFLGALPGALSSVAYTVADNGVTGGRSYFGEYEEATVWDTSGTWDSSGEARSVQTLLNAAGVDTSPWTRLVRVYAASDDGTVLAGYGTWAADGSTRGFVAKITGPPAERPALRIRASGSKVVISWPTNAVGYGLWQNSNLTATAWSAVTNAVTVDGTNDTVLMNVEPGRRFYRLQK